MKTTKNIIAAFISAAFIACSTMKPAEKAINEKMTAEKTWAAVKNKRFRIDVDYATPLGRRTIAMTPGFSLKVAGDSVYSFIPYYISTLSRTQKAEYGFYFNEVSYDYHTSFSAQDEAKVAFKVKNTKDTYTFDLLIYDNGKAEVTISSLNLKEIRYQGRLVE